MRLVITLLMSLFGLRLFRHWSGAVAGAVARHFISNWIERRMRPTPAQSAATNSGPSSDADLATLGLRRGASREDIEQAWRRLMARHHPDRAPETGRAEAERLCGEINAAYRRLRRRPTN